uniref:Uncharacterized protein n=1 Tax=Anguilla anguilla TaxID=7936 RepID=A0A0E9V779_ANGAN
MMKLPDPLPLVPLPSVNPFPLSTISKVLQDENITNTQTLGSTICRNMNNFEKNGDTHLKTANIGAFMQHHWLRGHVNCTEGDTVDMRSS